MLIYSGVRIVVLSGRLSVYANPILHSSRSVAVASL